MRVNGESELRGQRGKIAFVPILIPKISGYEFSSLKPDLAGCRCIAMFSRIVDVNESCLN